MEANIRRLIVLVLLWCIACVVAFFPARWAVAALPGSAKSQIIDGSVSGTIWTGQARVTPPLTTWPMTINFENKVLPLIFGKSFATLNVQRSGLSGQGSFGLKTARDIRLRLDIGQLPISDPRLLGTAGELSVSVDNLRMGEGCEEASGQVRTNFLAANTRRWRWQGPTLSGPVTCDGDTLVAALRGQDEAYNVSVDIRLFMDGRYGLDMVIDPSTQAPAEFGFVMSALGFQEQDDGSVKLVEQGQIFQGTRN
ncbi:MAG: type II secretion system protein N [Maricaulaceae bacterium]